MITEWHYKTAKAYAKHHHGHVNELRRNKASLTLAGYGRPQHLEYWKMENWLIQRGVVIDVSKPKEKPLGGYASLRHAFCCMRARLAGGKII